VRAGNETGWRQNIQSSFSNGLIARVPGGLPMTRLKLLLYDRGAEKRVRWYFWMDATTSNSPLALLIVGRPMSNDMRGSVLQIPLAMAAGFGLATVTLCWYQIKKVKIAGVPLVVLGGRGKFLVWPVERFVAVISL
jgi:hypothetical protein